MMLDLIVRKLKKELPIPEKKSNFKKQLSFPPL